jgi:hypothetical protein
MIVKLKYVILIKKNIKQRIIFYIFNYRNLITNIVVFEHTRHSQTVRDVNFNNT